jgi:hypothetical protein
LTLYKKYDIINISNEREVFKMEQKEFWVDFSGSFKIKATNEDVAKTRVVEMLNDLSIKYIDVNCVEEIEND